MNLLEKVRFLHQHHLDNGLDFNVIAKLLTETFECSVFILDIEGNFLGIYSKNNIQCPIFLAMVDRGKMDVTNMARLNVLEMGTENVFRDANLCSINPMNKCKYKKRCIFEVPMLVYGKRLGTIVFSRGNGKKFTTDEMAMFELVTTIIGMEYLYSKEQKEKLLQMQRNKIYNLLSSLTLSEKKALKSVLDYMGGDLEKILVTSQIADKHNVTRSIIVNVLKKLKAVNLAEINSLGAKGTHVKIKDALIFEVF